MLRALKRCNSGVFAVPVAQVWVDIFVNLGYLSINRARHASQRCALGGTFFARFPDTWKPAGKVAQS